MYMYFSCSGSSYSQQPRRDPVLCYRLYCSQHEGTDPQSYRKRRPTTHMFRAHCHLHHSNQPNLSREDSYTWP